MGADLETAVVRTEPEPVGVVTARSSRLHGTTVRPEVVPALIDEVPILAVAAAHAEGTFILTGAAELRVKESDRLSALAEGLTRLGVFLEELPDGLVVHGGRPLHGAAALTAHGATEIEGAECASVSFPEFFGLLARGTGRG